MVKQRRHRRAPLETLAVWPHSTARRGLAEEFVPFLFERFARRTNSKERRQRLARLGLAIARATRRPTAATPDRRARPHGSWFMLVLPRGDERAPAAGHM